MITIESKKVSVHASSADVFAFLRNTNNLHPLLPQNRISEWKSDGTECSFKIQGAYTIGLKLLNQEEFHTLVFESTPGSPFPLTLHVSIEDSGPPCQVGLVCSAQINPFLEMIVKAPLKNLFDYMADQLVLQFPAG